MASRDTRRHGCGTLALLVALVVLVAGLLVIDEVGRRVAEHELAQRLSSRLGATPEVDVRGWPFLAQVARNKASDVQVTLPAGSADVGGHHVTFTTLDVDATSISPVTDPNQAVAGYVDASTRLGYSSVSRAIGVTMVPAGGNRVRVTDDLQLFGSSVHLVLTGVPTVQQGQLVFTSPVASVDGSQLDQTRSALAASAVSGLVKLPTRAGMAISGLAADEQGITVRMSGDDVSVAALR